MVWLTDALGTESFVLIVRTLRELTHSFTVLDVCLRLLPLF